MSFNFDNLKEMSKNPMFWLFFIFCCGASFSLGMAVGPLVLNNQHAASMVFMGVFALISLYIWRRTSAKSPDKVDGGIMDSNISDNGALGDILKNWLAGWSKRKGEQMELAELKAFVPELLDFIEYISKEVKRRKLSPATVDFFSQALGIPIETPPASKSQLTAAVEDVISKMSFTFDGGVVEMPKDA